MNEQFKTEGSHPYKQRLWGALAHAFCLWATLAVTYNSYKAAVRAHAPLSREMRDSIQSAFPWAVLVFVVLYLVFIAASRVRGRLLSAKHYLYAGGIYIFSINILFLKKGRAALIVLDSSALLFLFTLVLLSLVFGMEGSGRLPRFFVVLAWTGVIYNRLKARPAALLIGAAVSLIVASAVLLSARQAKPALNTAYVSFIFLAAGVGIEVYNLVSGPKKG